MGIHNGNTQNKEATVNFLKSKKYLYTILKVNNFTDSKTFIEL